MKLSDNKDYLEHARLVAAGEHVAARRLLETCLSNCTDDVWRAFFLTSIGLTFCHEKDRDRAAEYFCHAEAIDPSPLSSLAYAKFATDYLGDNDTAIEKCHKAISLASTYGDIDPSFDAEAYIADANEQIRKWSSAKK